MSMRFFGTRWDAPATEGKDFEAPPVGAECAYGCGGKITETDSGVIMPVALAKYGPQWVVYHRDCFFADLGILPGPHCEDGCGRHPAAEAIKQGAARYFT